VKGRERRPHPIEISGYATGPIWTSLGLIW